jgi:hypothetical protein
LYLDSRDSATKDFGKKSLVRACGGFIGCRARAPLILGNTPEHFIFMVTATCPGCFLAGFAAHLTTHKKFPFQIGWLG